VYANAQFGRSLPGSMAAIILGASMCNDLRLYQRLEVLERDSRDAFARLATARLGYLSNPRDVSLEAEYENSRKAWMDNHEALIAFLRSSSAE
jgi:hypothetical protein